MYRLTENPDVILSDGTAIPKGHRLWQDYEDWLALGNTPAPIFSFDELKAKRLIELKRACTAAIESGFQSSALGSPHTYESDKPQDRENLIGARLANQGLLYTCIDSQGVKAQRMHTAAQILQVFNDGVAVVQGNLAKFYNKKAQLEAAQTQVEAEAVQW